MIVSYKYNYIFVKTNKTAGTSVEIALSTHTGEEDIITAIAPADELIRAENPNARLPQNFCKEKAIEYAYREVIKSRNLEYVETFKKKVLDENYTFRNHMHIEKIQDKLDSKFFDNAFKFTIERNPYDRIISAAYWQRRKDPEREIEEIVNEILNEREINNTDFYTIDGKVAVDFFIRYENMREGLEEVAKKIGAADLWSQLPQAKSEHRTDRRPPNEVLTPRQQERVAKQCKQEFELFGYEI